MTSQPAGPDFAGVLSAHGYQLGPKPGQCCGCGFIPSVDAASLATMQDYHAAHLVERLNAELEDWLRAAMAAAYGVGYADRRMELDFDAMAGVDAVLHTLAARVQP